MPVAEPLVISDSALLALVGSWLWPFARVAALVTAAPVFGYHAVPARVKLGLAVALTVVVAALTPPMPAIDPLSAAGVVVTAQQVLTGVAMGFALRLAFVVMEIAGQQIAQLMGLGFASMADPANGIEVPVLSHFYIILTTLVFLGLDGHLLAVRMLVDSFSVLPVGLEGIGRDGLWAISGQVGWVFGAGLSVALPAVAAMLTVNLAFGVMARAAPQLNIFVIGFPITLVFGMVVILFTLPHVIGGFDGLFARTFEGVATTLGAPR